MPELPEVEGFRALLDRHLVGRLVLRARVLDSWLLKDASPAAFARGLRGRRVSGTARRGKVLLAFTQARRDERDAPVLAFHFGMTGELRLEDPRTPLHRWDRCVLDLDDRTQLRYRNMRRLGFVRLLPRSALSDLLWGLGPDALEAPAGWFVEGLGRRRAPVKAVLLDQSFLAGLGNIYADEALHRAGIRPDRPAAQLSPEERRRLQAAIRTVLRRAVAQNVQRPLAPLRLAVPRRAGEPCARCGRGVEARRVGGRTAYFCPACQR